MRPLWLQELPHKLQVFLQSQLCWKMKIFYFAHTHSIPSSSTHLQTNCILTDSRYHDLSHTLTSSLHQSSNHWTIHHLSLLLLCLLTDSWLKQQKASCRQKHWGKTHKLSSVDTGIQPLLLSASSSPALYPFYCYCTVLIFKLILVE